MVKMTFTLDDESAEALRRSAARLRKPQSAVVREAIADYAARIGRLGDAERRAMLRTFDEAVSRIPRRPASAADDELRAIRRARRAGGRRHSA
jgi:hypothetical protein